MFVRQNNRVQLCGLESESRLAPARAAAREPHERARAGVDKNVCAAQTENSTRRGAELRYHHEPRTRCPQENYLVLFLSCHFDTLSLFMHVRYNN